MIISGCFLLVRVDKISKVLGRRLRKSIKGKADYYLIVRKNEC